jgi:hypothetical protein
MANRYNFIINAVQRKSIQAYPICLYETNKQTNKQTDRQNIMILYNLIYVDFQSSIRLLKMSYKIDTYGSFVVLL